MRYRIAGSETWTERKMQTNRYDTTWTVEGIDWEYQVRMDNGDLAWSDWSPVVRATARPCTVGPLKGIVMTPTATGIDVSWQAATGPYSETIDRYEVIVLDLDTPGAITGGTATRGFSAHIGGLAPENKYFVGVISWNLAGGGLACPARPVVIGDAAPAVPMGLEFISMDPDDRVPAVGARWRCGGISCVDSHRQRRFSRAAGGRSRRGAVAYRRVPLPRRLELRVLCERHQRLV